MLRNGWGASAIDALSTALVMRNKDVVDKIMDYVPKIDWSVSYEDSRVSLFETTIRYLGGLLSAYDLLRGPLTYLARNVCDFLSVKLSADTRSLTNVFGATAKQHPSLTQPSHVSCEQSEFRLQDSNGNSSRRSLLRQPQQWYELILTSRKPFDLTMTQQMGLNMQI
jgi:hypothetical protein